MMMTHKRRAFVPDWLWNLAGIRVFTNRLVSWLLSKPVLFDHQDESGNTYFGNTYSF